MVPVGERIEDVVPGGMELELQVKTGSWAGRTHSQTPEDVQKEGSKILKLPVGS